MNLDDVLSSPEMEQYFNNLPADVRQKLMKDENNISTSNELFMKAESLISNSIKYS